MHESSIATRLSRWGYNCAGVLGTNPAATPFATGPVRPSVEIMAGQVSAAVLRSVAVGTDGSVSAFGWNVNGQLGDWTLTDRHSPIKVAGMNDVVGVAAGGLYSLAATADGTV